MLVNATIAGVFRPAKKTYAGFYDIALIIGGSLLIALCAQVKVPLPFSPVPITGQTFAVLMIGALLGPRRGSLCALAYFRVSPRSTRPRLSTSHQGEAFLASQAMSNTGQTVRIHRKPITSTERALEAVF